MLNTKNILRIATVVAITFAACQEKNQKGQGKASGNKPDLLASHIDTTVHPGTDFFNYANGAWLKAHPIPRSESGYGLFTVVDEENKKRILKICQDASESNNASGSNAQLIGDFFSAAMDSAGAQQLGINAIKPYLDSVDAIANPAGVMKAIAYLQKNGIGVAYSLGVYADQMNSEKNLLYFSQGGLSLPDRDYYFNTDEQTSKVRNQFPVHVAKMLQLAYPSGTNHAQQAAAIVKIETFLAKNSRKLEALREPEKNYNKMAMANINTIAKGQDWIAHLYALGAKTDTISVNQPEYFAALSTALNTFGVDDWKAYLRWHLITNNAAYLSEDFVKENFAFYSAMLSGVKEARPRWKEVMDAQENVLGDALGQLYVKEYCSPKIKKRYTMLTENIVSAFREHIQQLPWMGDSTKAKAMIKLNAITKKVAYPDKWKEYNGMSISRKNYAQNMMNAHAWHTAYSLNKLGRPVDKTEWDMTPQTYNAYYNPSNNEIVLPAAMFIAPGYADEELDDAIIYGYVGASTIGHELTHGFDDEGRKFDEKGNMNNWWTKQDEEKFMVQASKLVTQFNNYTVLGNKHPNGAANLGENIADLGGVVIGFDAFKKTDQYKSGKKIGGLTPEQRYFLGYAYGWMQTITDEKLAARLLSDVHAPIFLRVNGPMVNCDAWYSAFNITKGHPMYKDSVDRIRIW